MHAGTDFDSDESNSSCSYDGCDASSNNCTMESLLEKYIIHLDVDCFYCQTEELRNPSLSTKPVAIGQKHIIVTSNYVARKLGVKKLQSRRDALRICPSLIIIEGSDLEPYRNASRLIYEAFRDAVKQNNLENSARKGGMDECFADITAAVEKEWNERMNNAYIPIPFGVWIYGDDSSVAQITEDQSGDSSISLWNENDCNVEEWGTIQERRECFQKMRIAAKIARYVQEKVKANTKFSTTIGVSSSPMLAKLASDLKKPKSCNVLYAWRSTNMIATMPLRRIPDLGSTTLREFSSALERYNGEQRNSFWTCRDLLAVPRHVIQSCLKNDKSGSISDLLLKRCRGIDTLTIVDDGGYLTKTVSVEDSFIRGSLTSFMEVNKNLEILFSRLLRLLDSRIEVSHSPKYAYPRAIRLTARIVDRSVTDRRPFRNISKQTIFNGRQLMSLKGNDDRVAFLKLCTSPLLQILTDLTFGLNVTRLNLAALSFADIDPAKQIDENVKGKAAKNSSSKKQRHLSSFFKTVNDDSMNSLADGNDIMNNNNTSGGGSNTGSNSQTLESKNDENLLKRKQQSNEQSQIPLKKGSPMELMIERLKRKHLPSLIK